MPKNCLIFWVVINVGAVSIQDILDAGEWEALLLLGLSTMEKNVDKGIAGLKIAISEFQKKQVGSQGCKAEKNPQTCQKVLLAVISKLLRIGSKSKCNPG